MLNSPSITRVCNRIAFAIFISLLVYVGVKYSRTPADPQKPVGYLFILIYCALLGTAVSVGGRLLELARQVRNSPPRLMATGVLLLLTGTAIAAMLVHLLS